MKEETTKIWELYEKGVDHHTLTGMYREAKLCHNMYIGDQWAGVQAGGEELPVFNFIKPIGKYKIAMIAQNQMSIVYSGMGEDKESVGYICKRLGDLAAVQWEKSKMDTLSWRLIKNAYITGDHYLYCYEDGDHSESVARDLTPSLKMRCIHKTSVYLSDEQNPDLNEQEWIILSQRLPVSKVRQEAKRNGVAEDKIALIVSDEETQTQLGESSEKEVKTDLGKCTCLLYMEKTTEGIRYCRSVRSVEYVPMTLISGLDVYPLVGMRWEERVGDARGVSGVRYLIANQLEVNKTAARRAIGTKRFSFPTMVYDQDKIQNVGDIGKIGANIAVRELGQNPISSMIQYLQPVPLSGDAARLQEELIERTRELEGAGDAATGQVDPTKASGEAIKAARDQAAVPLNEQIASYKQFVEDLAVVWYKMWIAYGVGGITVQYEENGEQKMETIPHELFRDMELSIKIDVSPVDPFSKVSQEIALDRLLQSGQLSFEEYIEALDDSSSVPKGKLLEILKQREQGGEGNELLLGGANDTDELSTGGGGQEYGYTDPSLSGFGDGMPQPQLPPV